MFHKILCATFWYFKDRFLIISDVHRLEILSFKAQRQLKLSSECSAVHSYIAILFTSFAQQLSKIELTDVKQISFTLFLTIFFINNQNICIESDFKIKNFNYIKIFASITNILDYLAFLVCLHIYFYAYVNRWIIFRKNINHLLKNLFQFFSHFIFKFIKLKNLIFLKLMHSFKI
jgi:hypothetical protein